MYIEVTSYLARYLVYLFLGCSAVSWAPQYTTTELEIHISPDLVTTAKRRNI